jgi:aminopeptidase N
MLLAGAILVAGCSSGPDHPVAGPAQGIGDPYYPSDGNPGYDVSDYSVTTAYDPASAWFHSTTRVRATATSARGRFDLDLSTGLTVRSVRVNGQPARFSRVYPHELVITPPTPLATGDPMDVVVAYAGPVGSSGPISGWQPLGGGAGMMAGEPHSCAFWYPCNDHPSDKATFHLVATVPAAFTVISNGLEGTTTTAGSGSSATATYRWNLDVPTTTYETTILIDRLTVRRSTLADGTPVVDAYSPGALGQMAREAKLPAILDVLSSRFGPYPAPAAGGLFVDAQVGFSLETFTRPVYSAKVGLLTIVHENAHQWWGDNVSIQRWKDICFNECMASYAPYLWLEERGLDLDSHYRATIDDVDFNAPLYDMGSGHEFDYDGVYEKGSYFVHALRRKVGDDSAFFGALQGIQADFGGKNISMMQFRDELSRRTGVNLTSFWQEWVLSTGKPSEQNLYPGSLSR